MFFTKREQGVRIGRIQNAILRNEVLTDRELQHHVHVVGASGFGKTVFLTKIVEDQIKRGKGMLFVDLKGDRTLIELFLEKSRESGRANDVQMFNLGD